METLKKGSKGDAVKMLQKALGISADGIFGMKTEEAVKAYQKKMGLVCDGIAGSKTLGALGIVKPSGKAEGTVDSKCIDTSVIYKPLPKHLYDAKNRTIKYLAIHFTASSSSKKGRALATYNTFMSRDASADFCVDDVDIVQFNPDLNNKACWAVGGSKWNTKGGSLHGKATNMNTVSIEICSTCTPTSAANVDGHKGWSFKEAALNNAVKIAKIIMKKYNIPLDRVVRHYDVSGKPCPGIVGWNDEPIRTLDGKKTGEKNNSREWERFKKRLE